MNFHYNFKTIIKDKFDLIKQRNAIMPNLIHSLDACCIAILYNYLSKNDVTDIYTVHDCFAVTAKNVNSLIEQLKSVYLFIYSDSNYLINLDNHIKSTIINLFGKYIFSDDGKYIYINDKEKIIYPNITELVNSKSKITELKKRWWATK